MTNLSINKTTVLTLNHQLVQDHGQIDLYFPQEVKNVLETLKFFEDAATFPMKLQSHRLASTSTKRSQWWISYAHCIIWSPALCATAAVPEQ